MDKAMKSLEKQWEEDSRMEDYVDWQIPSLLEKLGT